MKGRENASNDKAHVLETNITVSKSYPPVKKLILFKGAVFKLIIKIVPSYFPCCIAKCHHMQILTKLIKRFYREK